MFDSKIRKFSFRCVVCKEVMMSDFAEDQDIEDITNDKLYLECECGGKAVLLRD